jgi:hypothetical protein
VLPKFSSVTFANRCPTLLHVPRTSTNRQPKRPRPSRRYLLNSRWRGARLLPYMDDFLIFRGQRRRGSTYPRPRRSPSRPRRARTQPPKRTLGTHTNLRAPGTPHRNYNLYLPSPSFETSRHCYPLPDPTPTLSMRRLVTTHPTTPGPRRKKRNTSTSPSRRRVPTSVNSTTSSLLEQDGGGRVKLTYGLKRDLHW